MATQLHAWLSVFGFSYEASWLVNVDCFRPQGIMLQILLIMLFRISLKNPSLCSLLFFYAPHCYYYSIVPIVNNTMHKCWNVKIQVVYNNNTNVMLYY